jgi:tetratricopeptide (TPR) repeat protein
MVLRNAGRHAEALALLDEILPQMEKTHGPDDPQTITTRSHKIQTLFALKQHDKAAALCEETIARIQANSGATPTLPPGVMQDWSLALEKIGRYEKAVEVSGQLVAARRSADSRPLDLAYALLIRGRILFKLNRPAEAEPLFRDSLTLRAKADPTSAETASSKMWLGTALHGQRKDAEAETLLVEAFNGLAVPKNVVREWVPAELQLTAERLIAIYTAQNKPIEAAAWQKRLDGLKTETKPAGKQ